MYVSVLWYTVGPGNIFSMIGSNYTDELLQQHFIRQVLKCISLPWPFITILTDDSTHAKELCSSTTAAIYSLSLLKYFAPIRTRLTRNTILIIYDYGQCLWSAMYMIFGMFIFWVMNLVRGTSLEYKPHIPHNLPITRKSPWKLMFLILVFNLLGLLLKGLEIIWLLILWISDTQFQ